MPLCPASRPRQVASVPTASGDTSPTPVTTTRRRTAELKISTGGEREAGSRGSVLVPGIQLNVLDRLLDVADLLGFFVRDLDPELLLEGHDQLHDVEGVGAKVVGEAGLQGHLVLIHAQLLHDDALDPIRYSHRNSLLELIGWPAAHQTAVLAKRRLRGNPPGRAAGGADLSPPPFGRGPRRPPPVPLRASPKGR